MGSRRTVRQKPVKLHKELKRLLLIRRRTDNISRTWPTQVGGGIISQNGFRYDYREFPMEDIIEIRGGRKKGKQECFLLLLNPEDKSAVLQGFKAGEDCSLDGGATTKNMLKAAFKMATEKGATSIFIDDTAKKYIDDERYFYLSDMYFLTSGYTWYESAGVGVHPGAEDMYQVDIWRETARTNTWASVSSRMKPSPVVPVDISDIDVTAPGSAMRVFNRIKDTKSDFFVKYKNTIMTASNIGPIGRIQWVADL
jgi:hypothetical protein